MPSLINNPGNIVDVAANYRQQQVPYSRFGSRKVAWYKVGWADTSDGGAIDNANMNTMIDAIQTQAELVMVGAPVIRDNWGKFMVAVFEDTANDGQNNYFDMEGNPGNYNDMSKTLQQVLRDAMDDSNLEVSRWYLYGAPGTNFNSAEGWDDSSSYQEYDTRAQFLANSYTQPNP